ncbi:RIO1 family regulatory kinase/ATPase [Marinobacter sp. JSM 1782161]|uniref:RIO1 family regulatory kinase/ATPase domain-containing protein n=1 Tax=Marinobacter sp. JSM 1782161 TaxID=2685906 RepID=UPI0014027A84|nr:RIO1 family regulatory kinase/ATPase [Marinobacter sp. JSM 1782161]
MKETDDVISEDRPCDASVAPGSLVPKSPASESRPIQTGKGFLKADVFVYMHEGTPVICKDYQRYRGSWLAWPARLLVWREARILRQLQDWPHSPKLIGCMGSLGLLMEYVPGELLSNLAGTGDPMHFSQLMLALGSLHSQSITHNDVRGTNVIVSGGRVVLIDFASAVRVRGPGRFLLAPLRRSDMSNALKYKTRITGQAPTEEEARRYQKPRWIAVVQRLWKKKLLPWFKRHLR